MFYGWVILAVLCFNFVVVVGTTTYTYGTILVPMAAELGLTMTQASSGQTAFTLASAGLGLLVGQMLGKYIKPKTVIILSSISGIIAGALMAFVANGYSAYILCYTVFVSLMGLGGAGATGQVLLTTWFSKRRNTVVSTLLAMGGVGGFIFPSLTAKLIEVTGSWRTIWIVIMCGSAVGLILSALLLKNSPEEMGLWPDGEQPTVGIVEKKQEVRGSFKSELSFTQAEALKTPFFYVCVFTHAISSTGAIAMGGYMVAHLGQQGLTRAVSAAAVSIFAFCNIFGRVLSGVIQDRINPRTMLKVLLPLMGMGLLFVPYIRTQAQAWIFATYFGICYSLVVSCPYGVLMNTYGMEHYGKIFTLESTFRSLGSSLLALLPGVLFDHTGSYVAYFYVISGLMFTAFVLQLVSKTPQHKSLCSAPAMADGPAS